MSGAQLRVAVLGAGLMGSAIAAEYAAGGHSVRVTTSPATGAAAAMERVTRQLDELRRRAAGPLPAQLEWSASTAGAAAGADLVVESLPEVAELKITELAAAQEVAPGAILASNTSSLSLGAIGAGLDDPSRLIGTHYLNPPLAFRVLELVQGPATDPAVTERTAAILRALGKEPVLVRRDIAGFVLNRLQLALLREAVELVDGGVVSAADLDRLIREGLGRRWSAVGPFGTVALGGAATFRRVAGQLYPVLSCSRQPPDSLDRLRLDEHGVAELRAARDRTLERARESDDAGR